jgi:hypothetical protein
MASDMEYFIRRVGAWVQDAYVSIHHIFRPPSQNGKPSLPRFPGEACKTIHEIVSQSQYWCHNVQSDVYLAMGAQDQHSGIKGRQRLPTAIRKAHNTIACKAFYIDVDVDDNPKKDCYRSIEEMNEAINTFVSSVPLPPPNLVVNSGRGGKHLYWVLREVIHPTVFAPIARALANATVALALKCDPQCTTDVCRLLRVPGTYNYKLGKDKRLLVTIDSRIDTDYELSDISTPLQGWMTGDQSVQSYDLNRGAGDDDEEGEDDLGGGIKDKTYHRSPIDELDCPFIKDTLRTGGKDYTQTLWFDCLGIAAATSDPEDAAKRLSCGYDAYNESETLEKLAELQRSRLLNSSLGPAKCATINQDGGSKFCSTCPHLAKGSSPVSFSALGANNLLTPNRTHNQTQKDSDLPFGYYRGNQDGYIYHNDSGTGIDTIVLHHKIVPHSGYFEATNPWSFVFHTLQNGDEKSVKFLYAEAMDKLTCARVMANHGINVNNQKAYNFMQSYMTELRNRDKMVVDIPSLGWHQHHGVVGFAYDSKFVSSIEETKCQRLPPDQGKIGAFGSDEPWRELAKIVLDPRRPDLAVIAASGFASPLLHFTGQRGVIVGGWSGGSGIGKTTALSLAQGVWGSPTGMSGLDDTLNFVMAKAAMLNCLPLCYDEIKTMAQVNNLSDLIHNLTRGVEKGRLSSRGEMKPTRTWETQITFCANQCMSASVAERHKGTLAGLYRMFEFECLSNLSTTHSSGKVARMTQDLCTNFGVIGRLYADYLGKNYSDVAKFVIGEHEKYHTFVSGTQEERYWSAVLATIMSGAQFANYLGFADFPIDEMETFLLTHFVRMRKDQGRSTADYTNNTAVIGELSQLLNHYRAKNTVVTDTMILTQGKPAAGSVRVLNDKMLDIKKEAIHVHISLNPLMLRLSTLGLGQWCKQRSIPVGNFNSGMQAQLGAKLTSARLGSGTEYATGTLMVWSIPVQGTSLEKEVEWVSQYRI